MAQGSLELTKLFLDEIKLRAYDDHYIDRREEREILQYALRAGVPVETAQQACHDACRQKAYIVESKILEQAGEKLDEHRKQHQTLTREDIEEVAGWLFSQVQGIRSQNDCLKLIVELIEKGNFPIRANWFSNWFDSLKKELGLNG